MKHSTTLLVFMGIFLLCLLPETTKSDDWPSWLGEKRDSVWREDGILDKFPEGGLVMNVWAMPDIPLKNMLAFRAAYTTN